MHILNLLTVLYLINDKIFFKDNASENSIVRDLSVSHASDYDIESPERFSDLNTTISLAGVESGSENAFVASTPYQVRLKLFT